MASRPDVISRGFVYVRGAEELIEKIRDIAADSLETNLDRNIYDWSTLKNNMRNAVAHYIYETTKRSPMVLTIIEEI